MSNQTEPNAKPKAANSRRNEGKEKAARMHEALAASADFKAQRKANRLAARAERRARKQAA